MNKMNSKGHTIEELSDYIDSKEALVKRMLEQASFSILSDIAHRKKLLTSNAPPSEEILDETLHFADHLNDVLGKLYNSFKSKSNLFKICDAIAKSADSKLTKEKAKEAKMRFDVICNYSKREKENIANTGDYYNEDLCLYLMRKTFKKSAVDSYESFFRIKDLSWICDKNEVNITCLGGGPGSDLSGAISYLIDNSIGSRFKCNILDYNSKYWEEASLAPLTKALSTTYPKSYVEINYRFVDFNLADSIPVDIISLSDIIIVSWALNESALLSDFWSEIAKIAKNALIIIIEGKEDQVSWLASCFSSSGRSSSCELFENPRRLISEPLIK